MTSVLWRPPTSLYSIGWCGMWTLTEKRLFLVYEKNKTGQPRMYGRYAALMSARSVSAHN